MRAMYFEEFGQVPAIMTLPDPTPAPDGVVVKVEASGVCRSDWHGWRGHDDDVALPHVPGHELAGTVVAIGANVRRWRSGDRVTVPFVGGCGHCPTCHSGNQQVCPDQFQPGFTAWGSFAEYVALDHADQNLVRLPDDLAFDTAASLGCRFVTAFRGVVDQGQVRPGQWVAVHGCGGVGLSAIMIARAAGARVIAVDVTDEKLALARAAGAEVLVNATAGPVVEAVIEASDGGVHLSLDCLGHNALLANSVACLRRRGRHVQLGLMVGEHARPPVDMGRVIALELEILGSHGMQAFRYDATFAMIAAGALDPETLIGDRIGLEEAVDVLTTMDTRIEPGIPVITRFG